MAKKYGNSTAASTANAWDKHWKPSTASCYASHPALKFTGTDGVEYSIYGGNCSTPVVHDANVYVGFTGMNVSNGNPAFPWDEGYEATVVVDYPITDMSPPSDPVSFHKLVDWTCNQLRAGKKVHGGCHGGHGRTGMWLVAVVAQMTGMKDAIQYVRKNYCEKAVETYKQIDFLMAEFGVSKADETKKFITTKTSATLADDWDKYKTNGYQGSSGSSVKSSPANFLNATRHFNAVDSVKTIW
jgi:hypothetical protein